MTNDHLKNLKPEKLPSLPTAAVKLLELSRSEDATLQEVCDAIRLDPAIAARVLKAANSSYFGIRTEVASIDKAAVLLGPTVLTTITLTFCLAGDSVTDPKLAESYRSYWLRVVIQAAAADIVMNFTDAKANNSAFLAGLLCDLGQLAMLKVDGEKMSRLMSLAEETGRSAAELETEEFGIDHIELGMMLAKEWQLPKTLAEAIRYHHSEPKELSDCELSDVLTTKAAVLAAAVGDYISGPERTECWQHLQECCHELFGLDDDQIFDLLGRVHTGASELSGLFEVDASQLPDPETLISLAHDQLIAFSISANRQAQSDQQKLQVANAALAQQNEELQGRVIKDQLTQVYSRSFFEECVRKEVRKAGRTQSPIAVAFCDIDHFKLLNDKYGHQFGDEVLHSVAQALQGSLRRSDILARYGGEEFVAVLPAQQPDRISSVTERMRKSVQELDFQCQGHRVRVSISIGACTMLPGERAGDECVQRLVEEADQAMYWAKRNGRDQTRTRILTPADLNKTNAPELSEAEVPVNTVTETTLPTLGDAVSIEHN